MRIDCEFLGTGTSYGVPGIGCDCSVCTSSDPRNKRLRSSVLLRVTPADGEERSFLIDLTPDLRTQALRSGFRRIDAVFLTHEHADHIHGIDDLRAFYWLGGGKPIPLYAYPESLAVVVDRFDYVFDPGYEYGGIARLDPRAVGHVPFKVKGVEVQAIPVVHGGMRVAAFRIGDFAYITDANEIPPSSIEMLKGVKLLVIDALRRKSHPTHLSLPEALAVCEAVGVQQAYFTHINHDLDHERIDRELPSFAALGYDTLRVAVEDGEVSVIGDKL